jgi:alpha-1,2-mannosyltransferase
MSTGSDAWLTAKRIRAHGVILATCLWSVYFWNISAPGLKDRSGVIKGADFIHLYTLGSVALSRSTADLYDVNAQARLTAGRVPAAAGIRYVPLYPPQTSIFLAPLASLPYGTALTLWLILSSIIYGACCYALWRCCPRLRAEGWTVALLAIAFPGFFHLIVWGQNSAVALACFTAAFLWLRDERPFFAGLTLGCLIFKPQLGMVAALVFAYSRAWRVIAGAILSAAAQLAVPLIYYGADSLRAWLRVMAHVTYTIPLLEPRTYQTHSLRTFWTMLIPGLRVPFLLYVVSASVVVALTLAIWSKRAAAPLSLRYSALLLASVLVAPHLIVYDLVILAPVFLLLSDWILSRQPENASSINGLLYLAYLEPLVGPLARWTHVQISVVIMSVLLYTIWRASRDGFSSQLSQVKI